VFALIAFFFDLSRLRRAPQELPASIVLLGLTVSADLLTSILIALTFGIDLQAGFIQGLLDTAAMFGLLQISLLFVNKSARLIQTATALAGVRTVISLVMFVPLQWVVPSVIHPNATNPDLLLIGLLLLTSIALWSILATAHILRHTFDLHFGQGLLLAISYELITLFIVDQLLTQFR
jgi:hypothetical protein